MNAWRGVRNWFRAHENRVLLSSLLSGSAAVAFAFFILLTQDFSPRVKWTAGALVLAVWAGFALSARERVIAPLRTLSNLLEAMREGDYSIRGRGAHQGGALGEVMAQVNAMGATLRAQRLGAVEATALLRKVMEEIGVAVFTFDGGENLRFVNRAGERLLAADSDRMLGRSAAGLALEDFLRGEPSRIVTRTFPGGAGRWEVRRTGFRESGLPLTLLVVSDLTRALREEELQAWQRLVRVLGHELNNSLTPVKSIAGSLSQLLARRPRAEDWEQDMHAGLAVIASRADALSRFIGAYSRLARLPRPRLAPVDAPALVRRTANLETRLEVRVGDGPPATVMGDQDQLEQALINLIRNAADASLETGGAVSAGWRVAGGALVVTVLDEGRGLPNTSNLFVPFFTTKPGGSGIGLVLSRQIAEAHGGSLELLNRQDARGCEARLTLPV
jgi:nitrogen fixation/metabolism regulation signal transduction histidine kinase